MRQLVQFALDEKMKRVPDDDDEWADGVRDNGGGGQQHQALLLPTCNNLFFWHPLCYQDSYQAGNQKITVSKLPPGVA
jgi:hypothetical protein